MPRSPLRNLPRIYASVLLLDATTGKTLAILEGGWLTAMRTGAVSGLATSLLAREDADILALFGAGAQAPMQVLAIHTVRPLREVRVVNRNDEHYQQLVTSLRAMIGPFTPEMCEVDAETLAHARIVVDQRESALVEAGDLLQASGRIARPESWIELGDLARGVQMGRQAADQVTFFKSVGVAVQDVAVALHVYARARELGIGIEVDV